MDDELPKEEEELDLLERKRRMEELKKWRFVLFMVEILLMVGLICVALWMNGASSEPFYLPIEYPIYIILATILAITIEDFFFDDRRMRHLPVKLKKKFVDARIKSVLAGMVVSLILAILIWLPALHAYVNDDITRKGDIHVYLGGGEGNYQFTSQDELALTQMDRVNIQNPQKIKMTIYLVRMDVNKRLIAESSTGGEKDDEIYRAKLKEACMWTGYGNNVNFYPKDLKPGVKMPYGDYLFVCFNDDEGSDADVTLTFYRYVPRPFIDTLVLFCIGFFIADACWVAYLYNLRKKIAEMPEEEYRSAEGKITQRSAWTGEQVSCPSCRTVFPVYSNLRPIRVKCPACGKEGVLGYPPQAVPAAFVAMPVSQQMQPLPSQRLGAMAIAKQVQTQQAQQPPKPTAAQTLGTLPTTIKQPTVAHPQETQPQNANVQPQSQPRVLGTLPQKTQSAPPAVATSSAVTVSTQGAPQTITQPQPQARKGKEIDKSKLATLQSIDIALGKAPAPKTSIRCPGCKTAFEVGSERPIQVKCPNCGKTGTLR